MLLRDSVKDIQKELKALETLQQQAENRVQTDKEKQESEIVKTELAALDTLSPEEYDTLVQKLKAEIMEELKQGAEGHAKRSES